MAYIIIIIIIRSPASDYNPQIGRKLDRVQDFLFKNGNAAAPASGCCSGEDGSYYCLEWSQWNGIK
jgi:hypothetical protein